jgi:ABC-type bacteriocin/lantibiotic exporter with double-glycine peptidase domain
MSEVLEKLRPIQRFWRLLSVDRKAITQLYIFAFFAAFVSLSLPLGLQAIVNLIMSGQVTTSFYILIIIVVVGYALNGYLQILQISVTELVQRRIFTRAAFEFAYRIPRIQMISVRNFFAPELINRFFDTLSVQKGLPKILIDFAGSSIQILIGLILLSFYHPFFILFGVLAVVLVFFIVRILAPIGVRTALQESRYKYEVAHWLEELARTMETFKLAGTSDLPLKRADETTLNYLNARQQHFRSLLGHYYSIIIFKVVIVAIFLLLGGLLVIDQQMNIGQFVAAEIIVILLLSSVEKLIFSMDANYDVIVALEKLGNVTDLPLEDEGHFKLPDIGTYGMSIDVENLFFGFEDVKDPILNDFNISIRSGEKVLITGANGSGKNILLQLFTGMYTHYDGSIKLNGLELKNLDLECTREFIGDSLGTETIFYGTLLENITLGREKPIEEILEVIKITHLDKLVNSLPKGLETMLYPEGKKLPRSTKSKIVLARCLISNPRLILLDENLKRIHLEERNQILQHILDKGKEWTVAAIANSTQMAPLFERIIFMQKGKVVDEGTYSQVKDRNWFKNLSL